MWNRLLFFGRVTRCQAAEHFATRPALLAVFKKKGDFSMNNIHLIYYIVTARVSVRRRADTVVINNKYTNNRYAKRRYKMCCVFESLDRACDLRDSEIPGLDVCVVLLVHACWCTCAYLEDVIYCTRPVWTRATYVSYTCYDEMTRLPSPPPEHNLPSPYTSRVASNSLGSNS